MPAAPPPAARPPETPPPAEPAVAPLVGTAITVRYFAGARAAAGVAEDVVAADAVAAGLGLDELCDELVARRGQPLAKVLAAASFLVDGLAWHDRHAALPAGGTVDVLPPFAGG